jgi:hypothetical protein
MSIRTARLPGALNPPGRAPRVSVVLFCTLGLLALQAGCERTPTAPTAPPPPPAAAPVPPPGPAPLEFSLSGIVLDRASRALADAKVEVVDGPGVGSSAVTDASGRWVLPGIFTGSIAVRASKAGYSTETKRFPFSIPWPSGSFDLNFELDTPSVSIAGDYTLTITAASSCQGLPVEARTRTYQAIATASPFVSNAYDLFLSGASFYPFKSSIFARVSGDLVTFDVDPYSAQVVSEPLTESETLTFWGSATATLDRTTISTAFDGTLEYCADTLGTQDRFPYVGCRVAPVDCASSNHTVTLVHR